MPTPRASQVQQRKGNNSCEGCVIVIFCDRSTIGIISRADERYQITQNLDSSFFEKFYRFDFCDCKVALLFFNYFIKNSNKA